MWLRAERAELMGPCSAQRGYSGSYLMTVCIQSLNIIMYGHGQALSVGASGNGGQY